MNTAADMQRQANDAMMSRHMNAQAAERPIGRIENATGRLCEANERLQNVRNHLESIIERLCGAYPKPAPTGVPNEVRPRQPDIDELDSFAQSLIDRASEFEELAQRFAAL